jgi:hypothetical protein
VRGGALDYCLDARSSREPASTSLENAFSKKKSPRRRGLCGDRGEARASERQRLGLLDLRQILHLRQHLGRVKQGGDAIALVEVDGAVPAEVLAQVQDLPQVKQAKALAF